MRLAITSLGMVSSVGHDVVTACASVRAGLRRPAPVSGLALTDADGEPAPVIGFPLSGYADGFVYLGLWQRVATGCVEDLLAYGRLPAAGDAFWQRTGLALVLPSADRDRFPEPGLYGMDAPRENFGLALVDRLGLGIPPGYVWVAATGHAGTATAIAQARGLIAAGQLERVLVLAVDSYLDPASLNWIHATGRLKADDNPAGLQPGEGGACFLVEAEASALRRGAHADAILVGEACGREANHLGTDAVNTGLGMASAIAAVLVDGLPFDGDLFTDLNGETWRAYELACARVRLPGRIADEARIVLCCDSLGDIGAASGAAAVCMAARAFARGYAHGGRALVLSSSEQGDAGAILLERAHDAARNMN